jgi:hypothetical protein
MSIEELTSIKHNHNLVLWAIINAAIWHHSLLN